MKIVKWAAWPLLLAPALAQAAAPPPAQVFDVYYLAQSKLEVESGGDSGDIDGDGFGVRVQLPLSASGFRLSGEYQTATLDDDGGEIDVDQWRAGAGWLSPGALRLGVMAEYVALDMKIKPDGFSAVEAKPDGYGLHGRVEYDALPQLQLYGQVGYVKVEEGGDSSDGLEYLVGAAFSINSWFGLFADYRATDLKDGSDELKFDDLRVGLRLTIGAR